MLTGLQQWLVLAPPFLFALTVHEFAHGWIADRLGDPTARQAGRLTLNPLVHLDLIGTVMLFLVRIGWAKPVPVNPYNLKSPRRDMLWIALAGPVSNLLLALIFGWTLRLIGMPNTSSWIDLLRTMLVWGVFINLVLAAFNLFPVPPLDGSKVLMGILPPGLSESYGKLERYGFLPILLIVAAEWLTGIRILWRFIDPFVSFSSRLVLGYNL